MQIVRSLRSIFAPAKSLGTKWIPRSDRKRIRESGREFDPSYRTVRIETWQCYGEPRISMLCAFGPIKINSRLLLAIQDPATDWQELAELAAEIIGITNPAHIHQIKQVASGLGMEHELVLRDDACSAYRRSSTFDVENAGQD